MSEHKKDYKNEINLFTDEFIKNNSELRQPGTWVKYSAEPGNWNNKNANFMKLYQDLKDVNKDWKIVNNLNACQEELCGEMLPNEGILPGDIYVFYEKENGKDVPVFYLKIEEFDKQSNYIEFNGSNCILYQIDYKYLSEIILKLIEIDKNMNKKYIEDLKIHYAEYSMLLSFINKENLEEDEINFLYYMAYNRGEERAINKINERNLADDFKNFSVEGKIRLYLNIMYTDKVNDLTIDSKEVLLALAQKGCIKQLNNATEEIMNNKAFIIELINIYFSTEQIFIGELIRSIPPIYQNDVDVLNCIISNKPTSCINILNWLNEKEIECTNKDFAYKIINQYLGVCIKEYHSLEEKEELVFMALYPFSEEVIKDVEKHVLIGQKYSDDMELLKDVNTKTLIKAKKRVLEFKKNEKSNN